MKRIGDIKAGLKSEHRVILNRYRTGYFRQYDPAGCSLQDFVVAAFCPALVVQDSC